MTTISLATFPLALTGGKFIDGVKGAAAGMAVGVAIKGIMDTISKPPAGTDDFVPSVCDRDGANCRPATQSEMDHNRSLIADSGMVAHRLPSGKVVMVHESQVGD